MFNPLGTVLDPKKSEAKYPEARVIVLDDSFNGLKPKPKQHNREIFENVSSVT